MGLGICKGTVNVLFSFEEEGSLGSLGNAHTDPGGFRSPAEILTYQLSRRSDVI